MEIRVPKLGEGAESGIVISLMVKTGDLVKKDQTILELENEKAVAPIPSPSTGTVSQIHVNVGDQVSVGQLLMTLGGEVKASAAPSPAPQKAPEASSAPSIPAPPPMPAAVPVQAGDYQYQSRSGLQPPASPSVRRLSRELGLDLTRVMGTGNGGRISMNDLHAYIQNLQQMAFAGKAAPAQTRGAPAAMPESIDFSKWGPVTKKPLTSLRKKIGDKMKESWQSIPHVTQQDEADITDLMAAIKKYGKAYEEKGAKLTLTAVLLKACVPALQKHPVVNSSLDEASGEIVLKNYFHLGIAVDTEQGLIVPVLRDVDKKSVLDISKELAELAEKTRARKVSLDELQGGTFTISNLGGIGGTHFTPIINKPQAAILGVSRGVLKPVVHEKQIVSRVMMPLSLSYDHRVIDGADGARFIRALVEAIQNYQESEIKI